MLSLVNLLPRQERGASRQAWRHAAGHRRGLCPGIVRNLPTPVFQSFDDLAATSERLQAADMGFDQSIGMLSAAPRQSASVLLRIVDAGPLGCELSDRSIGGSCFGLSDGDDGAGRDIVDRLQTGDPHVMGSAVHAVHD